jgi:hypothetical protein
MAFGQRQILTTDLQPNVGIGVDIPFNANGVFRTTYQTKDSIKANLINYLLTNPGERIANPNFGAGIRAFVFEQITDQNLEQLEDRIENDIKNNIPNINLNQLDISGNPDFNQITISIGYSVAETGITDNVELTFS